jgi:hypothetical protein
MGLGGRKDDRLAMDLTEGEARVDDGYPGPKI